MSPTATTAVIEALHRLPGVLTASASDAGGHITVSHDSAVPIPTILSAAKSVAATVVLAGRQSTPPAQDQAPQRIPRYEAVRLAVAIALSMIALTLIGRLAEGGFARQLLLVILAILAGTILARPFLTGGRPR